MSNDLGPGHEALLGGSQPQAQPSVYAFAPYSVQQMPPREVKKNFVFVDEHNRHKRLKVMRACEGCRKRKIKCDAATTNTWPCSACVRLKLTCVRPNGYDDNGATLYEPSNVDVLSPMAMQGNFHQSQPQYHAPHPHLAMSPSQQLPGMPNAGAGMFHASQGLMGSFQVPMYGGDSYADGSQGQNHHPMHYAALAQNMAALPSPVSAIDQQHQAQFAVQPFSTPPLAQAAQLPHVQQTPPTAATRPAPSQAQVRVKHEAASPGSPSQDQSQQDLADLLGSLNVDEKGSAPYLRNKASFRREEPAVEDEDDYEPPPMPRPRGPGSRIRIPPDLMPADDVALHYFDLFFSQVHQYLPVLSRTLFYQQWHNDRQNMSPLVLEALFAISGRIADEPGQGQQWLALASAHADAFMDTPRLSTLQALLLILKAREAAPKRGYYYRSWMTVVQCVQMAKDLGLDEHLSEHEAGNPCGAPLLECQMKTRIWQVIFACETMTGAPQGRMEMAVGLDSVSFDVPSEVGTADEDQDVIVGRNFTYFIRVIRNIRKMSSVYTRVKKQPEWGLDPDFEGLNPIFDQWLKELPDDLAVKFPSDGMSPPWLPSTFHGNMLSYYHLTLILVHRPQLAFLEGPTYAAKWKEFMLICIRAAKAICRLQEGIINGYGLLGLQAMLRGYSFSVYAGLSCIVLHLVCMTSPDPDLHTDSSEYFTRHMRVIEQVMRAWPMPELKRQVDNLREAFSADLNQPFALKTTLPYNSPRPSRDSVSPSLKASAFRPPSQPPHGNLQRSTSMDQQIHMPLGGSAYSVRPMTPPVSAGPGGSTASPNMLALMGQSSHTGTATSMPATLSMPEVPLWNPNHILTQWDSAFGPPQPSSAGGGSSAFSPSTTHSSPQTAHHDLQASSAAMSSGSTPMPSASMQQQQQQQQQQQHHQNQHQHQHQSQQQQHQLSPQQFVGAPSFITPELWQQSVGPIYISGTKRTWADYKTGKE
jgi:hypothetical protein